MALQQQLMMQSNVATGQISFDDLETLIMTAVHRSWNDKKYIHNIEHSTDDNGAVEESFELGGEIYKLEIRNGKKFPVKIPPRKQPAKDAKKQGQFRGKC